MRFRDRVDAGRALADRLRNLAGRADVIVLGLPRGGVPVAAEVARSLRAPLDVFVARKVGVPGHPELAMGAVATGGVQVLNDEIIAALRIPANAVAAVAARERAEVERRERTYHGDRTPEPLGGRIVIIVDDGLATGATMTAAIQAVRAAAPARIVAAVPVGARETCAQLARIAEDVVCVHMPEPLDAVGMWYDNFDQTPDAEILALLRR